MADLSPQDRDPDEKAPPCSERGCHNFTLASSLTWLYPVLFTPIDRTAGLDGVGGGPTVWDSGEVLRRRFGPLTHSFSFSSSTTFTFHTVTVRRVIRFANAVEGGSATNQQGMVHSPCQLTGAESCDTEAVPKRAVPL